MTLPVIISPSQVQRKAPVDDVLMDGVRQDLNYLDNAIAGANTEFTRFSWNGFYNDLFGFADPYFLIPKMHGKMLGGPFIAKAQVLAFHDCFLDGEGQRGGITFDIRKYKALRQSIMSWNPLWQINNRSEGATIPIRPAGANPNVTGTAVVANGSVAVQSVTLFKAPVAVTRIEQVGYINHPNGNPINSNAYLRLYLASAPDSDYENLDFIILTGTGVTTLPVSGAMDNAYQIAWMSTDDQPCIEIQLPNPGDFAYNGGDFSAIVGASIQLCILQIDLANPADTFAFVPGEIAELTGMTTSSQNFGSYRIWKINQSAADNVVLKNLNMSQFAGQPQSFVTQGSSAGTLWSGRNVLTLDAALDTTVTNVGDKFNVNTSTSILKGCWIVAAVNHLTSPNVVICGFAFVDGLQVSVRPTALSQNPQSSISSRIISSKIVFDLSGASTDAGLAGVVIGDTLMFLSTIGQFNIFSSVDARYPVTDINNGSYPTPNVIVDLGGHARKPATGVLTYPQNTTAFISTSKLVLATPTDISASLVAGKSRVLITSNGYIGRTVAGAFSGVGPPSGDFDVLGVNVGPGTPKNIVVDFRALRHQIPGGVIVDIRDFSKGIWNYPVGVVTEETRSVFSTRPSVPKTPFAILYNNDTGQNSNKRCIAFNNGVLDTTEKTLLNGDVLGFEVYNTPQFTTNPFPIPPGTNIPSPIYDNADITLGISQDSEIAVGMRIG